MTFSYTNADITSTKVGWNLGFIGCMEHGVIKNLNITGDISYETQGRLTILIVKTIPMIKI